MNPQHSSFFGQGAQFAMPSALSVFEMIYLILIGDVSSSMLDRAFKGHGSKLDVMSEALRTLLDWKREHRPKDEMAVIAYSNEAYTCCKFHNVVSDYSLIAHAIQMLDTIPHEGTCMAEGLQLALDLVQQLGIPAQQRSSMIHVVAYSDGHDQAIQPALYLASDLKAMGCLVETFGIGKKPRDVNEEFLRSVATTDTDGINHYKFLGDVSEIHQAVQHIAEGSLIIRD